MLWNLHGVCIHVTCSIENAANQNTTRLLYTMMVLHKTFPPCHINCVSLFIFSGMVKSSFKCNALSWYLCMTEDPTHHLIGTCIFLGIHTCTYLNAHVYTKKSDSSDFPWYTTQKYCTTKFSCIYRIASAIQSNFSQRLVNQIQHV